MVDAGLFHDQKVELLDGTIVDMTPASPRHEFVIDRLVEKFYEVFLGRLLVRNQNAINIELPAWLPHPDVVLVKKKDYSVLRPTPDDVYLLVEVANTSLHLDKGQKREIYASVGIKEYWIADLSRDIWIINRRPEGDIYREVKELSFDTALALLDFSDDVHSWLV